MAEGGYERIPTEDGEGEDHEGQDNDGYDNDGYWDKEWASERSERERQEEEKHSPRRAESGRGEEVGMKQYTYPPTKPYELPTTKTSTSKSGEQETSFIDSPSAADIFLSREKAREELNKDIREVFPNINKKLLPLIRRDDYGQLVINLGKAKSKDWVIAFSGEPSHVIEKAKFPKGVRKDLGKTNVQINQENQEAYEKQQEKQAKREQKLEEERRKKEKNEELLRDAEEREKNLEEVVKEQEEAKKHSLTEEDKENLAKSNKTTRDSLRQVRTEVDGFRAERDRLEQAERNADERVQEGERQVETARERVNQRLLSLRDRIKEIFKKHGFTVIAVTTAIATVIGVIVSNLKAGLTKVAKGVGNGLKELGKKLGEILPGMIGAIASFLFRTAGEVIGFLAKNAWLLIVGLVVLAVEQFKKKSK